METPNHATNAPKHQPFLSENIGKFHSNETIEMKFDWKNLQISSICSGNSVNTSFHMFDWTHFQRKLTMSYKLTNEMKFFQSSFISFCSVGIQWGKSIWTDFQRNLMISGTHLISNNWYEILPIKLHFTLFGWNTMREINMFDWTHFRRKLIISGNSYKPTNEMKFLQSNFISICWLEYNEGNQYVWLDTFPKEINDLWKLL